MTRMSPKMIPGLGMKDFVFQRGHTFSKRLENEFMQATIQKKIVELEPPKVQGESINAFQRDFYSWFNGKKNRELVKQEILKKDVGSRGTFKIGEKVSIPCDHLIENEYTKTFEWYVSEIFEKELGFVDSAFGALIDGAPEGGDYDVLANTPTQLVYVECKSGRADGVDADAIRGFVNRAKYLTPDISILYVDNSDALKAGFPMDVFQKQFRDGEKLYQISRGGSARLYRPDFSSVYLLDNTNGAGDCIESLRLVLRAHHHLDALHRGQSNVPLESLREHGYEVGKI